jgi:hypothetical protein
MEGPKACLLSQGAFYALGRRKSILCFNSASKIIALLCKNHNNFSSLKCVNNTV